MDTYDYNEDNLSTIARSCSYLSYRRPGRSGRGRGDVSCSDCGHWNGRSCARNHFDSIASEMRLD